MKYLSVEQIYKTRTFTLTEDHVKLLRRAYVGWQDCETGAPEVDPKRPYGNSSVAQDIAEILGEEYDQEDPSESQDRRLLTLHRETQLALQVVLATGAFKLGNYKKKDEYDDTSWFFVK